MKIFSINANDNSLGGASRVAMDLHEGLLSQGLDSFIAVGKKSSSSNRVHEIPRGLFRKLASAAFANDFEFFESDEIMELDEFNSADIIHCHNLNGWYFNLSTLVKISKQKPIVWTLHDMWPINPHSGYTSSTKLRNNLFMVSDQSLYPTMLWNNDRYLSYRKNSIYQALDLNLVSPSHWLKNLTMQTSLGRNPISVIANGVDVETFSKRSNKDFLKKEFNFGSAPIVLFVGASANTNKFKGFDDFLWLSEQPGNRNIQFVCVGADDNYSINNMRYIKATADKDLMAKYLSVADVFLLTSKFENFPLVVLEALSCGTPVISYDVGGVSEILKGLDGCYLCNVADRQALAQNLYNFLNYKNEVNLEFLALHLRQKVLENYSKFDMVKNYIKLYQSILSSRN